MFICAAGDIHGAMDRFYDDALSFEDSLGAPFDYVLHVGDFGVQPAWLSGRIHETGGSCAGWLRIPAVSVHHSDSSRSTIPDHVGPV